MGGGMEGHTKSSSIQVLKSDKYYIKVAGFPLYKTVKKFTRKGVEFSIYLLGLPLILVRKNSNGVKLDLLVLQNILKFYNQKKKFLEKQKQIKIAKKSVLKKFHTGTPLNLCIQVSRPGMWCFDYLYDLLEKDPRFNLSVVIMPDHNYEIGIQKFYLEKTYEELSSKGYCLYKGYDYDNDKMLNIRKEINPDIIFFTDFWKPHFYDDFYITNFPDKITFLNEYGFSVMQDEKTCAWELNNLVDLYFRPTEIHRKMAQKLMINKGKNVVVTGSPKLDALFDKNYSPTDVWKKQSQPKKRIIWAPHYTDKMPDNMYKNDAFWEIYDFMLDLAEKYKNKIQFVFRPHPVLKKRAIEKWGLSQQEAYYEKWNNLSNGQYYDGNFIDLFMTSDAMIMDSCSFRAEYTAFDKPLFLTITQTSRLKYNEFGEMLNKLFYKPEHNLKQGIIDFIENVVLKGEDVMSKRRHEFVQKYFGKINGRTASENIYHEIINFLEKTK